jgi:hypothetical protein
MLGFWRQLYNPEGKEADGYYPAGHMYEHWHKDLY